MMSRVFFGLAFGLATVAIAPTVAPAYTPLIDEVEGVQANPGYYLILPAFENTDPATRTRAYFIMPKYLVIAGDVGGNEPQYQFGVSHHGFSLFEDGAADFPPSVSLLAAVELYKEDAAIQAIKDELTERDLAQGLDRPVFPTPVFKKFETFLAVIGKKSEPLQDTALPGGYAGQLEVISFTVPSSVERSFVLELPPTAGANAALWGVTFRGTVPGLGNRLDCQITIWHRKVYDHFKSRASAQAFWGLVKGDISSETQLMDQNQAIDFGKCRGRPEDIEKIAMPIWQKIIELGDQNGNQMFTEMLKDSSIPGHPEAADSGWGFQASAGWESVEYKDNTSINFNIAFPLDWTLPMAMTFSTTCTKWQKYFINETNPSKPCVEVGEIRKVAAANKKCHLENIVYIKDLLDNGTYDPETATGARRQANKMGCLWDGSTEDQLRVAGLTQEEAAAGRECREEWLTVLSELRMTVPASLRTAVAARISRDGCQFAGGPELQLVRATVASLDEQNISGWQRLEELLQKTRP